MAAKSTAARRSRRRVTEVPSEVRELDRIDHHLLTRLQQDGRLPISELATEVHLSVSPCFARVRRLEALGYISGYFAHLNPVRLGLGLQAYISVQLDTTTPEVFQRFAERMVAFEEVLECHMVGGGFDYLVKVRVRDMASFRKFLGEKMASVRGVQQTHTYFVMEEVKSTHKIEVPTN